MKKLPFLLSIAFALPSAPLPITAKNKSTQSSKRKNKKSTKSTKDKRTTLIRRAKWGIATTLAAMGFVCIYQHFQGKEPEPNPVDPVKSYKAFLDNGEEAKENLNGGTLLTKITDTNSELSKKLTAALNGKDNKNWKTWIIEENNDTVNAIALFLQEEKYDIKTATGNEPNIARIEHGFIDGSGISPIQMGYILAQMLHLLKDVVSEEGDDDAAKHNKVKNIIGHNDNRFLANLVDRHGSNAQKVDEAQADGHNGANCIPSIHVLLTFGANPAAKPKFNDSIAFKDGNETIEQVAAKKAERKRLVMEQKGDEGSKKWTVKAFEKPTTTTE